MKKFIGFLQKILTCLGIISFMTFGGIRIINQCMRNVIAVISANHKDDLIIMNPEVGVPNYDVESWVMLAVAIIFLGGSLICSYWSNVKMEL